MLLARAIVFGAFRHCIVAVKHSTQFCAKRNVTEPKDSAGLTAVTSHVLHSAEDYEPVKLFSRPAIQIGFAARKPVGEVLL